MSEQADSETSGLLLKNLALIADHLKANNEVLLDLQGRMAAREAANSAVAKIVDENEDRVTSERQMAAAKELVDHAVEKGQQYATVVIGGAFAAYFATLSTVSARFSDIELAWSAMLMTTSLTAFVLWEVFQLAYLSFAMLKGTYGKTVPAWFRSCWAVALFITLATAVPAIGLDLFVYARQIIHLS